MYTDRLLPHDPNAEEAVIGSLIIDPNAISMISNFLKPEDFLLGQTPCTEAFFELISVVEGKYQQFPIPRLSKFSSCMKLVHFRMMCQIWNFVKVPDEMCHFSKRRRRW